MVRDWCQYRGEGVSEDEDEGGEDLLSLLLLFNLDHCVDLIASRNLFKGILSSVELSGHLDVFSLGAAAGVCSSWRRFAPIHLCLNDLNRRLFQILEPVYDLLYCSYFRSLLSPSFTCRAWRSPVPSPTFLHCRSSIRCL